MRNLGDWFVLGVGLLQLGAAVSYAYKHKWTEALIWIGATLISFGTLVLILRGR